MGNRGLAMSTQTALVASLTHLALGRTLVAV